MLPGCSHCTNKFLCKSIASDTKDQLLRAQLQEEAFWKQKSHMHWLKEGDRNTKFFHSSTLKKRASSTIRELEDDQGNMIRDAAGLSSIRVSY